MDKVIERFEAQTQKGKKVTICKWVPSVKVDDLDSESEIPGLPYLRTLDGKRVTNNGDGTYRIEDGIIVRRMIP